jgi:hypothetical protein
MDWESDSDALRALQDDIYRGKILRARQMTVAERLMSVFECSSLSLGFMYAGVQLQKPGLSEEETWNEVGARIFRARRLHDHGYYRMEEEGQ